MQQMTETRNGNCYEAAINYLADNAIGMGVKEPNHNLRLVHAEVAGTGKLRGRTLGHAWIEDGDTVIDTSNGKHLVIPKDLYYAIGRINEINNIHVYTPEEARQRVLNTMVYGPWELSVEGDE
jgi:hypothetical protein